MNKKSIFAASIVAISMLSACQKHELFSEPGQTPIRISTNISKVQSRVTGSSFDSTDRIGLFVLEQPETLNGKRHIDNECLEFDGTQWNPAHPIYFPGTKSLSHFIAYYPYRENILAGTETTLTCEVETEQNRENHYAQSDLLVVSLKDIASKEEAVELTFKHKLASIYIELKPGTAFSTPQELWDAKPVITLKNLYTRINYDFLTDNFSNAENKQDIVPYGELTVQGDKLTGKKAVVVPQTILKGETLIELTVGGKNFRLSMGEDNEYLPGTKNTYTLTLKATENQKPIEGILTATVSDWNEGLNQEGNLDETTVTTPPAENEANLYSVSIPDFSRSSVYKVMNGTTQIAEICREYLHSGKEINAQAIVAYPVKGGKADLTKGWVLQVLDKHAGSPQTATIHGGTVSWDSEGALTYTGGTSGPLHLIYIDKTGNFSAIPTGNSSVAALEPDLLTDTRDRKSYPIVKIQNLYWMGQNIAATTFTNGTAIPLKQTAQEWKESGETSCYCTTDDSTPQILYNFKTIGNTQLAPEGWQIPSKKEWEQIIKYTQYETNLMKDESWNISDNRLNLTGFSISNTKARTKDGTFVSSILFWHTTGSVAETMGSLQPDTETSFGASLRCIRQ